MPNAGVPELPAEVAAEVQRALILIKRQHDSLIKVMVSNEDMLKANWALVHKLERHFQELAAFCRENGIEVPEEATRETSTPDPLPEVIEHGDS